jgi:DNA-binding transcriptional LysR family regulator
MRLLKAAGISKASMGLSAPDTSTILGLVANGLGCAIVPASLGEQMRNRVVIRKVDDLNMSFDIELVWRTDERDVLVKKFVEIWSALAAAP